jgi:hypothetical protein
MDRDDFTLRHELERHFAENGFPPDGGLNDRWVVVRAGRISFCFPNVPARRRATIVHDVNHVVSGYGHDALGEAEIAAWELGGGCKGYVAAWVLNCGALWLGLARSPRRLSAAFVRGRRTRNLYGTDVDEVVDLPLSRVRFALGLDDSDHEGTLVDLMLFVPTAILALPIGAIPAVASIVTSPVWLAQGAHRARRPARPFPPS